MILRNTHFAVEEFDSYQNISVSPFLKWDLGLGKIYWKYVGGKTHEFKNILLSLNSTNIFEYKIELTAIFITFYAFNARKSKNLLWKNIVKVQSANKPKVEDYSEHNDISTQYTTPFFRFNTALAVCELELVSGVNQW